MGILDKGTKWFIEHSYNWRFEPKGPLIRHHKSSTAIIHDVKFNQKGMLKYHPEYEDWTFAAIQYDFPYNKRWKVYFHGREIWVDPEYLDVLTPEYLDELYK